MEYQIISGDYSLEQPSQRWKEIAIGVYWEVLPDPHRYDCATLPMTPTITTSVLCL